MKKITLLLSLLISTIGFSQNLLQNGDFENTDPGNGGQATGLLPASSAIWTTSMTAATRPGINMNADVAHGGAHFMNVQNDFQSFRQPFTAEVGKEYTVKFWNQFISGQGQPASTDGIYVSIRDTAGTNGNGTQFDPIISFYIDPSTVNSSWNEFTFTFTAPQSNLLFFVSKQARAAQPQGTPANPNNAARMDDFSIVKNETASLEDLKQFNFSAYPNPASTNLTISASKNIENVEIFNVIGQKVMTLTPNNINSVINVSSLNSGVYILKATIEGIKGSYKFVKQ